MIALMFVWYVSECVCRRAPAHSNSGSEGGGGDQKKQKIKETVVVAPIISSFVDLSNEDWEEVYQIATKTTEMLAKGRYVFCFSPGSPLGVGIEDKDGRCVVVGKRDEQTPLEIDDIIVSVNGINLTRDRRVSDRNVLKTLVSIIKNSSNVEKSIVVVRQHQTS